MVNNKEKQTMQAANNAIGRAANFTVFVANVDEIKDLPWFGNFASDSPLFQAIDDFVIERATSPEIACAALHQLGVHGMGIDNPVTVAELSQYVDESGRTPVHYQV
jgi:hypothetical protein